MSEMKPELYDWLTAVAEALKRNAETEEPSWEEFPFSPDSAFEIISFLNELDEEHLEEDSALYSASVFAFDICIAQLHIHIKSGRRSQEKLLNRIMELFATVMLKSKHTIGFWIPLLDVFYEAQIELIEPLKQAFLSLTEELDDDNLESYEDHLNNIRSMIADFAHLSDYEVAAQFFAQSYAMPDDFYIDFLLDLFRLEEGKDIALLMLLHPKHEVRSLLMSAMDSVLEDITLTSASLTRLQVMERYAEEPEKSMMKRWIRLQRKQGILFTTLASTVCTGYHGSAVDGSGSQGLLLTLKSGRRYRCVGIILTLDEGVRDVWFTEWSSYKDMKKHVGSMFSMVNMRSIDEAYFNKMMSHFLSVNQKTHRYLPLKFFELQEMLGIFWMPESINATEVIEQSATAIVPFTQELMFDAFKDTRYWLENKSFAQGWFLEDPFIDKCVNQHAHFKEGVKVCDAETVHQILLVTYFEEKREYLMFLFLWNALWLKSSATLRSQAWKESLLLAHALLHKTPLQNIPIVGAMIDASIFHSLETMNERRTYLN